MKVAMAGRWMVGVGVVLCLSGLGCQLLLPSLLRCHNPCLLPVNLALVQVQVVRRAKPRIVDGSMS